MPFVEEWSSRTFSILKEIVEGLGYECKRADDLYGKIILKDIWQQINEAVFIIADLTSNNPNVFMSLGLPILLVRKSYRCYKKGMKYLSINDLLGFFYEDNIDGYKILHSDIPKWIANLSYTTSPQMMIKNQMLNQFNNWRTLGKSIRFVGENFSGIDLQGINLSSATLSESSFSDTKLNGSNFSRSILIRTDFSRAILQTCDLHEANLSESNLESSDFLKLT